MFQLSFGYSAEVSGWLLAPIALMSVVFKRFIGHILNMLGYKNHVNFIVTFNGRLDGFHVMA